MIKVNYESMGQKNTQELDADSFESEHGFLTLRKKGNLVATFAMGWWSSVEKHDAAPQIENPASDEKRESLG